MALPWGLAETPGVAAGGFFVSLGAADGMGEAVSVALGVGSGVWRGCAVSLGAVAGAGDGESSGAAAAIAGAKTSVPSALSASPARGRAKRFGGLATVSWINSVPSLSALPKPVSV